MSEKKQATWGGRFSEGPADQMVRFSESVSFDQRLAPYDIQGSMAHARMLASVGLVSEEEAAAICSGLERIGEEIRSGNFTWDPAFEDVHMNIEQALTKAVPEAAKLHTARSRNDQVATDMRLFFMDAGEQLASVLKGLMRALLNQAEAVREIAIPGYTHLQRAQPVSMAHHLLAYMEMFSRDLERVQEFDKRARVCPLGSGAIAGTTLPIDREFVARELGFVDEQGNPQVTRNSMDAVADRDLFIEFAGVCSLVATHLSRVAEDIILWSSQEFGFVRLPDAYTTGSSLMPQKKNPDSLELIRGKSARIMGQLTTLLTLVKGLPLTYNRDLQEDKPPVFDCLDMTLDCLLVLEGTIAGMAVNPEPCKKAVSDPLLLATDLVDYLVLKGVPFRDAHHIVGALVGLSEKSACSLNDIPLDEAQKICPQIEADWTECFSVKKALSLRERPGMPGPQQIGVELKRWKTVLNS
ncbi:argininosuccinate lyase [Puniceicoccales bacterium CK1056]|uniref:Argininosuccinate lyase n=1 Tax=Oceanipulchritudo coccoides TaxID=2706888 RepID=A0A6B2LZF7_9BACT|nr:argininosuccinate lyase [Oceanipulchritudo coccoides]NDV60910.1 argininosuccinate lyase [Oceanipulchritudo coccoides]